MRKRAEPPGLSRHDSAIWHTIDIMQRVERGGLDQRPTQQTMFRPHIGTGERVLSWGNYQLCEFTAAGDGSYAHNNSMFFATGGVGLAMTGAFAAGRAIGNSRRKAQAAADARQCWRQLAAGNIFVSTHGFYFHEPSGLLTWSFGSVSGMEVVGPAAVTIMGTSDRGQVYWLLNSEWAELVFTLWAHIMFPDHPQLRSMAWIPAGWQERTTAAGHALPSLPRPGITP